MARYALVIGITDYVNRNFLPPLSKPAKDAEAMAQFLESTKTFEKVERLPHRWIPQENRYEVMPGKVRGEAMLQALQNILLGEPTKNQEVLIYFSGHGFCLNNRLGNPEGYLATSDSQPDGKNAISLEKELNPLLQSSHVSHLIVLLDCSHSEGWLEKKPELDRTLLESSLSAFREKQDYYLLAACPSKSVAQADEKYSLFTSALLGGLSAPQSNPETGEISGERLFSFVSQELRRKGQEVIRLGWGKSLILVRYSAQSTVKSVEPLRDQEGKLRCPYQGLLAFTQAERPFFFGRKQIVEELARKLERQPCVPLIGASGSGKSSLVLAGLVPWLEQLGWQVLEVLKPGFKPLLKLEKILGKILFAQEQQLLAQCFQEQSSEGLKPLLESFPPGRYLLVVDQFEELFTVAQAEQRDRFIKLITQVADFPKSPLAIVITLRADFLEPCLYYDSLRQLIQNNAEYLPILTGADLVEAITKPAKRQGYQVMPDLLEQILVESKQEPNCLPLLEFALTELWQKRDEEKHQLTKETYESVGGTLGALNRHANQVYHYRDYEKKFPQDERSEEEKILIKRIFLKLLQIGDRTQDTKVRQPQAEILSLGGDNFEVQEMIKELIAGNQGLVKGRLLVTGENEAGEEPWVDLAHEVLIEGWEQLNEWRTENPAGRKLAKQLEKEAQNWQQYHQSPDYLWQGFKLGQAQQIREECATTAPLSQLAKDFVEASMEQELRSYLCHGDLDSLNYQWLKKEATVKFFLTKDRLRQLLEKPTEEQKVRLAASWLLKHWGEQVPLHLAEIDEQENIHLTIIESPPIIVEQLGSQINLEMVKIPSGEFWMGATQAEKSYEWEHPQHKVTVSSFLMSKYPITQAQWRAVASLPSVERELELDPAYFKGDNCPVECVSWYDAIEFCRRLSRISDRDYRLPSEAEWEYACRSGTTTPFNFGNTISPDLANYSQAARGRTTPVGRFQVANAFGLYDMHGNTWEWCEDDWHDNYEGAPTNGTAWLSPTREYSVIRGGSCYNTPLDCRSASRLYIDPYDDIYDYVGFRVVSLLPRKY